jgi:hypothetical protein
MKAWWCGVSALREHRKKSREWPGVVIVSIATNA